MLSAVGEAGGQGRALVGREVAEGRHGVDTAALPAALKVQGMARGRAVRGADLTLHAGEVLGLAGLVAWGERDSRV